MKIEDMMKKYTDKYVGELDKDFVRDIDCETAKVKYLLDEYLEGASLELDALKGTIKRYFDLERAEMHDKSNVCALDADSMAHDLVHDLLVIWTMVEKLVKD